ncbi:MAG: hypothetical protein HN348_22890, partial [Proteobacteria bacterium]|nr:hypothetical protein [Pseudomonadota bacterium]
YEDNQLLFAFATSFFGTAVGLGGVTLFLVERNANDNVNTVWDGIWWALVTITTVGFGDISPETSVGRLVGGVVMILGMVTLAMFAGIVGQSLLNSVLTIREEQFRMSGYVNHLVVCGFEASMEMLLGSLRREAELGQTTVVLFASGERPSVVPPEFVWVSGDPTKANQLDKVRLTHASGVIIIGSRDLDPNHADAITILTAFTIRRWIDQQPVNSERQTPLYIVAEILDLQNSQHAFVAGADEVIETTQLGCDLMAHAVAMPGTAAALAQVVKSRDPSLFIGPLFPSGNVTELRYGALVGAVKQEHGAIVIGVKDADTQRHILMPSDDMMVCRGTDVLYLSSSEVQLRSSR